VVKVTEALRLKIAEKGPKKDKEVLHDMVMMRLARYVEKEEEDTLNIPLKHSDDEGKFEDS
jgi:hypothetical protein